MIKITIYQAMLQEPTQLLIGQEETQGLQSVLYTLFLFLVTAFD